MAPPQARQKNNKLVEVAKDSFALLDEFYGRDPKKSKAYNRDHHHDQHNHHNQQSCVYWGPQVVTVKKPIINSNEAAQFYGGMEIVDHHHQRNHHNQQSCVYWGPQAVTVRKPVINSNEAAQFYGGMEIVDYTIGKAIGRAY